MRKLDVNFCKHCGEMEGSEFVCPVCREMLESFEEPILPCSVKDMVMAYQCLDSDPMLRSLILEVVLRRGGEARRYFMDDSSWIQWERVEL